MNAMARCVVVVPVARLGDLSRRHGNAAVVESARLFVRPMERDDTHDEPNLKTQEREQGVEFEMRQPGDSLSPLISDFIRDKTLSRAREGTLKNYQTNLGHFDRTLGGATLRNFTPATVKSYAARFYPADPDRGAYTARNKVLILKCFAAWLAEQKLWYLKGGGSVLSEVSTPEVPKLGRKPYEDHEVKTLVTIASASTVGLRDRAILLLMLGCTLRPVRSARSSSAITCPRTRARWVGTWSSATPRPRRACASCPSMLPWNRP